MSKRTIFSAIALVTVVTVFGGVFVAPVEATGTTNCSLNGLAGTYYNLPENHPDVGGPINGVVPGTTPFQFNWFSDQYKVFEQTDAITAINVPANFFPVDTGLAGDPQYFAVHWTGSVIAPAAGTYTITISSDDDAWLYIDGVQKIDLGGIHALTAQSASVPLPAGSSNIDIYFAERHVVQSGIVFTYSGGLTFSPCDPVTPPECVFDITKSVDKTTATSGDTLTYRLDFKNTGTRDCSGSGVMIQDTLNTNLEYVSETHSSNVLAGYNSPVYDTVSRKLRWNADVLSPQETGWITFVARIADASCGTTHSIPNTAKISASEVNWGWVHSNTVTTGATGRCTTPTADIKANSSDGPITIAHNTPATLSWSSTNTTSCTISPGNWTGVSGSQSTGNLTAGETYTLTCAGAGGTATDSVRTDVNQSLITADIKADASDGPITIPYNTSAALSWTSAHATSCTVNPGAFTGLSGSQTTGNLILGHTYTVTCLGPGGTLATDNVRVEVGAAPVVTADIKANSSDGPITIDNNTSATISWTSANATSCTVTPLNASGTSGSQSSGNLTINKTYSVVCTGIGGSASDSITVNVRSALPTVAINANPATINSGNSSVLTWTSTNAAICTASGGWTGTRSVSGTQTVTPTVTTTYTITCTNTAGSANDSTTVTVRYLPTVDLIANPADIDEGDSSILTWSSTNADACTASVGWTGTKTLFGSQTVMPAQTTTYTITCTNTAGTAIDSATIAVHDAPNDLLPTVTIIANPSSIQNGGSSILTWSSTHATSCSASQGWSGTKTITGSQTVSPTITTTYKITCTNTAGSANDSTTVTVQAQVLPPTVDLVANPMEIETGDTSILTWSSSNATSCSASMGWSDTKSLSGSQTITPTVTTTYTITCTNSVGTDVDTATVIVQDLGDDTFPSVSIIANPSSIQQGNSSILSWSSSNATICSASNGWSGTKSLSGTLTISPSQTTTYTITCTNSAGSANDSTLVSVSQQTQIPIVSIIANPSIIQQGNSSILSWSSSNATNCSASNGWSGTKSLSGSQSVSPFQTTTYTITCQNSSGQQTSDSTTITVQNNSGAPTVILVANPTSITQGASTILSWSSSNATSCFARNGWGGAKSLSGSETASPSQTATYTITCTGSSGSASDTETVTVSQVLGASSQISISKASKNTALNQSAFFQTNEAQGLDVLEFEIRVRNIGSQSETITLRDLLPQDLFYVQGSTQVNGLTVGDGIAGSSGISLGTLSVGEEKSVRFRAVIYFGAEQRLITNQAYATSNYGASQTGLATIQIRNRGKVLGAGTVTTGPESTLPWLLLIGFLGSMAVYMTVFPARYRGTATLASALSDAKLQYALWAIRKDTKRPAREDDLFGGSWG